MRRQLLRLVFLLLTTPAGTAERFTGPWKMAELTPTPVSRVAKLKSNIREVVYETSPSAGKPTRVFAYYAGPEAGQAPFPAMVLVHGGGGKAFKQWAALWADRGYARSRWTSPAGAPTASGWPTAGPSSRTTRSSAISAPTRSRTCGPTMRSPRRSGPTPCWRAGRRSTGTGSA